MRFNFGCNGGNNLRPGHEHPLGKGTNHRESSERKNNLNLGPRVGLHPQVVGYSVGYSRPRGSAAVKESRRETGPRFGAGKERKVYEDSE